MPQSTAPPVHAKKTKTAKAKSSGPKGIKPKTFKAKAPQSKAATSKDPTPEKASAPKPKHPTGLDANIKCDEIHIVIDDRYYRIRGLDRNHSPQQLKVDILARRDELVHLDTGRVVATPGNTSCFTIAKAVTENRFCWAWPLARKNQ